MKFPNPVTFVAAVGRTVKAKLKGEAATVSEKKQAQRLVVCAGCDDFNWTSRQCNVCTCFVDLKTMLSTERCPRGLWK